MHLRRFRLLTALAALAALVTLGAAATPPAHAGAVATSGPLRIAYSGNGSRSFGACTVNPSGSNNVCLQNGFRPVAAPGGGELYFVDFKDDTTTNMRALYKMRADGTDTRLLYYNEFSFGPISVDVSPDASLITYDRYDGNSLFALPAVYVANADGTGERLVAGDGTFGYGQPSFSPDGSTIAFVGCPTIPINAYGHICTVPTAGGQWKVVATEGDQPQWGANGQIAYHDVNNDHVMLVNGDGTNKIDTGIVGNHPALSPDGRQLAFVRMPPLSNVWHIWVANVDGSSLHEVAIGEHPVWFTGATAATAAAPAVTVTSPAGGQIVGGQPVTFTWTATGNVASQSIVLEDVDPTLLNGRPDEPQNPDVSSLGFTVVSNLPGNVRSYTWTPPASMNWKDRVVRIAATDTQGQIGVGLSGTVKTRPAPQIPPYVRVAYPSEPTDITWYTGGSGWTSFVDDDPDGIARLEARLSLDGGATFPIVLVTDATGWTSIMSFTVPDTPTDNARVKVTAWDTLGNSFSDVSDTSFRIVRQATVAPVATLASVGVAPSSVAGGASAQGTVTLTAAAPASGASVTLSSSSAAAAVPASVAVPAGATSVTFAVTTKSVASDTRVTITGSYGGATSTGTLTVTAPAAAPAPVTDTVSVTRAEYDTAKKQLRLEATSSSTTATLKAYVTSSGALIGTVANNGGGKYSAQLAAAVNPQNVTVRSSLGGSASRAVVAK